MDILQESKIIRRINTGIKELDELLYGGLPERSITLVSGPPGSGKSILCFQFLYEGIKNGEQVLYLSLDKKEKGVILQAKAIGFDFQPAIAKGKAKFRYLNINKKQVYETMTNEIMEGNYTRIVLDSITPLSEMPLYVDERNNSSPYTYTYTGSIDAEETILTGPTRRRHLRFIITALESTDATSIITSELPFGSPYLSRDGISEFLADGVILLNYDPTMDRRKLSVIKMRNTKHTLKPQNIQIGYGGIQFV